MRGLRSMRRSRTRTPPSSPGPGPQPGAGKCRSVQIVQAVPYGRVDDMDASDDLDVAPDVATTLAWQPWRCTIGCSRRGRFAWKAIAKQSLLLSTDAEARWEPILRRRTRGPRPTQQSWRDYRAELLFTLGEHQLWLPVALMRPTRCGSCLWLVFAWDILGRSGVRRTSPADCSSGVARSARCARGSADATLALPRRGAGAAARVVHDCWRRLTRRRWRRSPRRRR